LIAERGRCCDWTVNLVTERRCCWEMWILRLPRWAPVFLTAGVGPLSKTVVRWKTCLPKKIGVLPVAVSALLSSAELGSAVVVVAAAAAAAVAMSAASLLPALMAALATRLRWRLPTDFQSQIERSLSCCSSRLNCRSRLCRCRSNVPTHRPVASLAERLSFGAQKIGASSTHCLYTSVDTRPPSSYPYTRLSGCAENRRISDRCNSHCSDTGNLERSNCLCPRSCMRHDLSSKSRPGSSMSTRPSGREK
jgi:hypothetical protein